MKLQLQSVKYFRKEKLTLKGERAERKAWNYEVLAELHPAQQSR